MFAEYYQYQAGAEPKFLLGSQDKPWFSHFMEETETLWKSATPVDFNSGVS
jgi:hypothetical protein